MAAPREPNLMETMLPLLGLMQQKRAQDAAAAAEKKRNQISALNAATHAKHVGVQAEQAAIQNQAAKLALTAEKERQNAIKAAREMGQAEAANAIAVDRGDGVMESDVTPAGSALYDKKILESHVRAGELPATVLLTPEELAEGARTGLNIAADANTTARVGLGQDNLRATMATNFASLFPTADPTIFQAMTAGDFSRFNELGDSTTRLQFAHANADRAAGLYATQSQNYRAIAALLSQETMAAQTAGSNVRVAQLEQLGQLYKTTGDQVDQIAKAIKNISEAGGKVPGQNLLSLSQRLFAATNTMQKIEGELTNQNLTPLDAGTTGSLFGFGGESTSLYPSGAVTQNVGTATLPPSFEEYLDLSVDGTSPVALPTSPSPNAEVYNSATPLLTQPTVPTVPTVAPTGGPDPTGYVPGPPQFEALYQQAEQAYGLPPGLMSRLAFFESTHNPQAKSSANARGLTQMRSAAMSEVGVTDATDPAQQVYGGAAYLAQMVKRFGSVELGLAAYNWGPGNVQKARRKGKTLKDFPKGVQEYVQNIAPRGGEIRSGNPLDLQPKPQPQQNYTVVNGKRVYGSPEVLRRLRQQKLMELQGGFPLSTGEVILGEDLQDYFTAPGSQQGGDINFFRRPIE